MNKNTEQNNKMFWATLIYFIILSLFAILRILDSFNVFDGLGGFFGNYSFTIITQIVILFLVPFSIYVFALKVKPMQLFKNFGFKKIGFKTIIYAILFGFIAYFIIVFVSSFFSSLLQMFGYEPKVGYASNALIYPTFWSFLLGLLFVAVLPGFFEEFVHRGLLTNGLSKLGAYRVILLCGLLFGLMHLNILQFFYAFIIGILLTLIALATKSIWPSIIIHFMNNGINVYVDFARERNLFGGNIDSILNMSGLNSFIILKFFGFLIFLMVIIFLAGLLIYKMFFNEKKRLYQKYAKKIAIDENGNARDREDVASMMEMFLKADTNNNMKIDASGEIKPALDEAEGEGQDSNKSISNSSKFFQILFPAKPEDNYKPTFKETIFLKLSICLGSIITIMTFIWGFL